MRIYRCTDKIEVKIDDVSIFVSPLSFQAKMNLQGLMLKASNGDMDSAMKAVIQALKVSIKDIKGVQDGEGEYQISFDGEEVSDDCINDILNMPISNKISTICTNLLSGIPNQILDSNGEPLEGVSIVQPKAKGKK